MEYAEGGQLMEHLGSDERYVSRVIKQLLDAVEYLHSRGIVHRDIKPENIVMTFDVRLLTFRTLLNCVISAGLGFMTFAQ